MLNDVYQSLLNNKQQAQVRLLAVCLIFSAKFSQGTIPSATQSRAQNEDQFRIRLEVGLGILHGLFYKIRGPYSSIRFLLIKLPFLFPM